MPAVLLWAARFTTAQLRYGAVGSRRCSSPCSPPRAWPPECRARSPDRQQSRSRRPRRARKKWRELALSRKAKAPFFRALSRGFSKQVPDCAAFMSSDIFGGRGQEKMSAAIFGRGLFRRDAQRPCSRRHDESYERDGNNVPILRRNARRPESSRSHAPSGVRAVLLPLRGEHKLDQGSCPPARF